MLFNNRAKAGKLLAEKLLMYEKANVVVYAIPRGGVVPAVEIASRLSVPLDLIITRKIGHPYNPEYAVAAIAENGHIVGTKQELEEIDMDWLKKAIEEQRQEVKRRKYTYQPNKTPISLTDKTVILVDDGIATGLTTQAAIQELRRRNPQKFVVAIPVIPQETFRLLSHEVDEVVTLHVPHNEEFLGAVGAYYETFPQISDTEVINILRSYEKKINSSQNQTILGTK